jgi:transcriptional regulator with XRE-family HTH domain
VGESATIGDVEGEQPWGARLQAWREARNWTREDLRDHVERASYETREERGNRLDIRLVARWERGETRRPQAVYLRLLTHLGAPVPGSPAESSAPIKTPASDTGESLWLPSLDTSTVIAEFTRQDLAMNRRDLHRLVASLFVGGPLLDHLDRWLPVPVSEPTVTRTAGTVPVGVHEVDELETAARLFRDWDDRFGGGLRRKAVVGQLNEVSEMIPDMQAGPIRQRLYRVMAQLAETAAMMSWDSGLQSTAQRYYVLAIRAAHAGSDPAFAANAMAGMARQLLYLGRASDALEVVRLARTSSEGVAGPRLASMLAVREAWAYAHLDRLAAFERATATAEEAFRQAGDPAEEPYWIHYFDNAELNGTIGGRLIEIAQGERGRPTQAVAAATRITRALGTREDGRLRASAMDLIGLAQAHMLSGDLDEGARIGHDAIEAAGATSSDRVRVMLRDFHGFIAQNSDSTAVQELRARVKSAPREGAGGNV